MGMIGKLGIETGKKNWELFLKCQHIMLNWRANLLSTLIGYIPVSSVETIVIDLVYKYKSEVYL
jgi:hypothetical protein